MDFRGGVNFIGWFMDGDIKDGICCLVIFFLWCLFLNFNLFENFLISFFSLFFF